MQAVDKPLLRGVSHLVAVPFAALVGVVLVRSAPPGRATIAAGVYTASLLALFVVSALYHRVRWGNLWYARMKRLDHANIFVFIAGSYTPICLLGVGGARGTYILAVIATGAVLGVAQTLVWPAAPRALHVALYVAIGWAGALGLTEEWRRIGVAGALWHVLGGVLYTVGAITYARRRPNPIPHVFGYHEVFHLLVIAACGCLYVVIRRSVALG